MSRGRSGLLCVLLSLAACRASREAEPSKPRPQSVRCQPVQSAVLRDEVSLRGTVAAPINRDVLVAAQVAGRVLRLSVREGDAVALGQTVAQVDDAPLLDAAEQADAALARVRAEDQNARTTLVRVRRVFEQGIAARQEVDDAAAKEASAKAALAEAQAAARLAHRQIGRASVHSPLKGVVLKILRKPGELVDGSPATPVLEIADLSQLELVADVPAQDLVRLQRGAPATIELPAEPGRSLSANVAWVSPAVDRATGVGSVRLAIANPGSGRRLPPVGVFGVARAEVGEPHPALLVPEAALRGVLAGEGELVVCGADHVAHVRRVARGPARMGMVEVRGPVSATERVAVAPVLGLSDGEPIEAVP